MSQNFFYDINKKLGAIFGKSNLTESANPGVTPSHLDEDKVETQDYSWGTLKIIRHGKDYSIILHPEHQSEIGELEHGESVRIRTETGDTWNVIRDGDELVFDEVSGSGYSVVPRAEIVGVESVDEGFKNEPIRFHIDTERAYEAVLDQFGDVIDWDEEVMTVPSKHWPAIQELAYAAGGEAIEDGYDQMSESMHNDIVDMANRIAAKHGGSAKATTWSEKKKAQQDRVAGREADRAKNPEKYRAAPPGPESYPLGGMGPGNRSYSDESAEPDCEKLDELSKDTLKSYVKKAAKHRGWHGMEVGSSGEGSKDQKHHLGKMKQRQRGIERAVDRLDELSKDTLKGYYDKALTDLGDRNVASLRRGAVGDVAGAKKHAEKAGRRERGLDRASSKLNELSKDTLKSYVKKAAQDSQEAAYASGADYERGNEGRHLRGLNHADKRQRGIERAVDKLDERETITTVDGSKATRPGSEYKQKIIKNNGKDPDGNLVFTVKKPNGFYGVLVTDPDMTQVYSQTHGNHTEQEALQIGKIFAAKGEPGLRRLPFYALWYRGGDKIVERAGPVGGGTWQDHMHLEEADIDSLVSDLRKAWGNIDRVDPSSPVYSKLIAFLDDCDQEHLKILADAGVKFVSMLAKNRLRREEVDEGYRIIPPIDDGYEQRPGLEGPFNANGRPIYYDPREGKYWDPRTDFYLDDEEASTLFQESDCDECNMVNELSKDTLKSYKDKSRAREHEIMKNHEYGTKGGRKELGKRVAGQMAADRALDRGEEKLDELSKNTLKSYAKKAATSALAKGVSGGDAMGRGDYKKGGEAVQKAANRTTGIHRAVDRLTRESNECDISESEMNIGDTVRIVGRVNFSGEKGTVKDFGQDNRFVVVDLGPNGVRSFHASDVEPCDDYDEDDMMESYDDFGPGLQDDDPWDRYGFESMQDVINAGISSLNDGMSIREILNMMRDEGIVKTDAEVKELLAGLKKGGSVMESYHVVVEHNGRRKKIIVELPKK